jgi:hypothetical protein
MRSPCCLSGYLPNFVGRPMRSPCCLSRYLPNFVGRPMRSPCYLSGYLPNFVGRPMRSPCYLRVSVSHPNILVCSAVHVVSKESRRLLFPVFSCIYLLSVCLCACVFLSFFRLVRSPCSLRVALSLLGNGPSTWVFSSLFVFYAVLLISKETRQLVLSRTSYYSWSLRWLYVK